MVQKYERHRGRKIVVHLHTFFNRLKTKFLNSYKNRKVTLRIIITKNVFQLKTS